MATPNREKPKEEEEEEEVMKKYKLAVELYVEDSRKGKLAVDDFLPKMCLPQNQD